MNDISYLESVFKNKCLGSVSLLYLLKVPIPIRQKHDTVWRKRCTIKRTINHLCHDDQKWQLWIMFDYYSASSTCSPAEIENISLQLQMFNKNTSGAKQMGTDEGRQWCNVALTFPPPVAFTAYYSIMLFLLGDKDRPACNLDKKQKNKTGDYEGTEQGLCCLDGESGEVETNSIEGEIEERILMRVDGWLGNDLPLVRWGDGRVGGEEEDWNHSGVGHASEQWRFKNSPLPNTTHHSCSQCVSPDANGKASVMSREPEINTSQWLDAS